MALTIATGSCVATVTITNTDNGLPHNPLHKLEHALEQPRQPLSHSLNGAVQTHSQQLPIPLQRIAAMIFPNSIDSLLINNNYVLFSVLVCLCFNLMCSRHTIVNRDTNLVLS